MACRASCFHPRPDRSAGKCIMLPGRSTPGSSRKYTFRRFATSSPQGSRLSRFAWKTSRRICPMSAPSAARTSTVGVSSGQLRGPDVLVELVSPGGPVARPDVGFCSAMLRAPSNRHTPKHAADDTERNAKREVLAAVAATRVTEPDDTGLVDKHAPDRRLVKLRNLREFGGFENWFV